jgi:hypothetical protein
VRETCCVMVEQNGVREACGKPAVHSQPCMCDVCGTEPGIYDPIRETTYWCAEHYSEMVNPPLDCCICGGDDHWPCDCPSSGPSFEELL